MTLTTKLLASAAFLAPITALAQTVAPVVVQAPSTLVDFSAIIQPILAAVGAIIAGFIASYAPKALAAFQDRTKIQLTENQRQTILGAVRTAAGKLETQLDQGILKAGHITVSNPAVAKEVQAAINAAPGAMAALDMTPEKVASMVVGSVNTGLHGDKSGTTVELVAPDSVTPPKVIVP